MKTEEERFTATIGMASDGFCPCCDAPGVDVHVMDGPAARWKTWSCGRCGYQLREHVRKPDPDRKDVVT